MIIWYDNNRVTGKQMWSYETFAYSASTVEDMLCKIVMQRKKLDKYTYISICNADRQAVAGIRVDDADLYSISGMGHIGSILLYDAAYKIRFSSFGTIGIIPVQL